MLGWNRIEWDLTTASEAELRDAGAVEIYESPRVLLENLGTSIIGKLSARVQQG